MNANAETLRIARVHALEIEDHLRQLYPEEGCGLVAGKDDLSQAVLPVPNQLRSPHRFFMEPIQLLSALEKIDANDWELLAIYHSHPHGPPVPSAYDLQHYLYPETPALIWFPERPATPGGPWDCRAYRIDQSNYQPIELRLLP